MAAYTKQDICRKYNVKDIKVATWRDPFAPYVPPSARGSKIPMEAYARPYVPKYRLIVPSPKVPQTTDDEGSGDDEEDPVAAPVVVEPTPYEPKTTSAPAELPIIDDPPLMETDDPPQDELSPKHTQPELPESAPTASAVDIPPLDDLLAGLDATTASAVVMPPLDDLLAGLDTSAVPPLNGMYNEGLDQAHVLGTSNTQATGIGGLGESDSVPEGSLDQIETLDDVIGAPPGDPDEQHGYHGGVIPSTNMLDDLLADLPIAAPVEPAPVQLVPEEAITVPAQDHEGKLSNGAFAEELTVEPQQDQPNHPTISDANLDALLAGVVPVHIPPSEDAALPEPSAETRTPVLDNASLHSEDKHVSFAPGTPEPKPTKRKKKTASKDGKKTKRRSSSTGSDDAADLASLRMEDLDMSATNTLDMNESAVVEEHEQPSITLEDVSPIMVDPIPAIEEIAKSTAPDEVGRDERPAAKKSSSSKTKSAAKGFSLLAAGAMMVRPSKSKASKSSMKVASKKEKKQKPAADKDMPVDVVEEITIPEASPVVETLTSQSETIEDALSNELVVPEPEIGSPTHEIILPSADGVEGLPEVLIAEDDLAAASNIEEVDLAHTQDTAGQSVPVAEHESAVDHAIVPQTTDTRENSLETRDADTVGFSEPEAAEEQQLDLSHDFEEQQQDIVADAYGSSGAVDMDDLLEDLGSDLPTSSADLPEHTADINTLLSLDDADLVSSHEVTDDPAATQIDPAEEDDSNVIIVEHHIEEPEHMDIDDHPKTIDEQASPVDGDRDQSLPGDSIIDVVYDIGDTMTEPTTSVADIEQDEVDANDVVSGPGSSQGDVQEESVLAETPVLEDDRNHRPATEAETYDQISNLPLPSHGDIELDNHQQDDRIPPPDTDIDIAAEDLLATASVGLDHAEKVRASVIFDESNMRDIPATGVVGDMLRYGDQIHNIVRSLPENIKEEGGPVVEGETVVVEVSASLHEEDEPAAPHQYSEAEAEAEPMAELPTLNASSIEEEEPGDALLVDEEKLVEEEGTVISSHEAKPGRGTEEQDSAPPSPTLSRSTEKRRSGHWSRPHSSRKSEDHTEIVNLTRSSQGDGRRRHRTRRERDTSERAMSTKPKNDQAKHDYRGYAPEDLIEKERRRRHRQSTRGSGDGDGDGRSVREVRPARGERDRSPRPSMTDSNESKSRPILPSLLGSFSGSSASASKAKLSIRTERDTRGQKESSSRRERRDSAISKKTSANANVSHAASVDERASSEHGEKAAERRRRRHRQSSPEASRSDRPREARSEKNARQSDEDSSRRSRRTDENKEKVHVSSKRKGLFGSILGFSR